MRIPSPHSLNRQLFTAVGAACLLLVACAGVGLWILSASNARIVALAEGKAEAISVLARLDAISQRLALSHPRHQGGLPAPLADSLDAQFNATLAEAGTPGGPADDARIAAVAAAWRTLLDAARDPAEPAMLATAQQQLSSHLQVLGQTLFAALEQARLAAHGARHAALLYALGGALAAMLLGAWLVLRQVARLSRGLHTLGRGMAVAAAGDLAKRVELGGCSELEALGEGFNYMAAELEQQSHELRASEQGLLTVMNSAPDAIITIDMNGLVASWNAAAERLFAYRSAEMLGQPLQTIFDPSQHAEFGRILAACRGFQAVNDDQAAGPWELTVRRKDGLHKPVEIIVRDMQIDEQRGLVVVARDITERKAAAEKLAFLTQHDSLTHLPNRSLIRDLLVQAMSRADSNERLVGIVTLGVDQFSDVNDNLGHALGDALLLGLSERINERLSRRDCFGRIGGDEFCAVIDGVRNVDQVSRLADDITIALAQPFRLGGHEVFASVSMGIAIYPFDDESPEVLLKRASAAMYRCKRTSSRNYLFYADDMNARRSGRIQLTAELKRALESEQFRVFYQPQYEAASGRLVGAEALLRWEHPQRGLLAPTEFIRVLDESGLIVPVGRWVMDQACRQSALWHRQGLGPLRLSLNVSARQFKEDSFLDEVAQLLASFQRNIGDGMAAQDLLEFELTEGVVMEDTDASRGILAALREMGIKLAVDDFGTGYSSLSYLKQFPIDALKIDQSFVQDIGRSQDAELIVQAIIDLAHALRLLVVGEGVETRQQLDFLRDKGCDLIQGYIHSTAIPPEALQVLLETRQPVD